MVASNDCSLTEYYRCRLSELSEVMQDEILQFLPLSLSSGTNRSWYQFHAFFHSAEPHCTVLAISPQISMFRDGGGGRYMQVWFRVTSKFRVTCTVGRGSHDIVKMDVTSHFMWPPFLAKVKFSCHLTWPGKMWYQVTPNFSMSCHYPPPLGWCLKFGCRHTWCVKWQVTLSRVFSCCRHASCTGVLVLVCSTFQPLFFREILSLRLEIRREVEKAESRYSGWFCVLLAKQHRNSPFRQICDLRTL